MTAPVERQTVAVGLGEGETLTATLGSAALAGSVLVAHIDSRNNVAGAVDGFTQYQTQVNNGTTQRLYLTRAAGGETSVTVTFDATPFCATLYVREFTGCAGSTLADAVDVSTQDNPGNTSGTSQTSGTTATTTVADAIASANIAAHNGAAVHSGATNSYTLAAAVASQRAGLADGSEISTAVYGKTLTATGAQETTGSWSTSARKAGHIVVLRGTAGGGGVTGDGALTAPVPSLAGAGTVTTPVVTGAGTLASVVASVVAAATVALTGSGAVTAPAPSMSGAAVVSTMGVGALTAAPAGMDGAGALTATGAASLTAPPATLAGTGASTLNGTGALTAAPGTLTGTGDVAGVIAGTGALTAAPAGLAGAGTATVTATGAITAPSPVLTGAGSIEGAVGGTGALAGPAPTLTGTGTQNLTGTGTFTAAPATVSGAGAVIGPAVGTGQITAPPAALAGTGGLSLTGTAAFTSPPAALAASGSVFDPSGFRDLTLTVTSLPDRWATTSLPATIAAEATDMHDVHVGHSEYQRARVTETDGQDITAATLEATVTDTILTPTSGWVTPVIDRPSVNVADLSLLYTAATQGQKYLWVRITDNPEVAARNVGSFSVLP